METGSERLSAWLDLLRAGGAGGLLHEQGVECAEDLTELDSADRVRLAQAAHLKKVPAKKFFRFFGRDWFFRSGNGGDW